MPSHYLSETESPTWQDVQALPGLVLLEFGTEWCVHCRAARAPAEAAMASVSDWRHLQIEDGPGRKLGRHFKVKRWPTFVALRDGQELGRCVRPTQVAELERLLSANAP